MVSMCSTESNTAIMIKTVLLFHLLFQVVLAGPPTPDLTLKDKGEYNEVDDEDKGGLKFLFDSENSEGGIWKKEVLQPAMSIRIVLKAWKPSGPSSETNEKLKVYKWGKDEAFKNLKDSPIYGYVEKPLGEAHDLLTQTTGEKGSGFDKNLPNIMIIHPLSANADTNFVQTTVTALALRNLHLYNNIFVVNMPSLNMNMFMTVLNTALGAPPMYEPIAELLGDFFIKAIQDGLMKPADIHLIGWSYSGQLVGYIGRYIKEQVKQPIGSIIALDPNGNAQNSYLKHVNENDAQVVHVYHTNSFPFGSMAREGTADFTFNNGMIQPECIKNPIPMLCSHSHVVQRFWYVILYGPDIFKARLCDNIMQFRSGACDKNPTVVLTYPIGNNPASGSYFLSTSHTKPYGLQEEGSVSLPMIKNQLQRVLQQQRKTGSSHLDTVMLNTNYL